MTLDIAGAVARGGKAAEVMAEENRPSGGFEKIFWFKLDDKEKVIIRFLDDAHEWPSVLQHNFVPTKPAPDTATDQQKANWPKQFGSVCRKTPQFVKFFVDGCYICDQMHERVPNPKTKDKGGRWYPQLRLWARAVERKEVKVENEAEAKQYGYPIGAIIGYRDEEVEVDETGPDGKSTGKKITKKKIFVINLALPNFFSPMQGYADAYQGTVLDRDYQVTRKGSGTDTDYIIAPMDKMIRPDGSVVDMREPEVVNGEKTGRQRRHAYLDDAPDVFRLIEDRLSDDVYHRFFDHRYEAPVRQDKGASGTSNGSASDATSDSPAPSADQQATQERLRGMRERVKGENPVPTGESADAGDTPAPVKPTGPINFE